MNTAEIVKREMQGDSGFHVCQFFAESIGKPRQPAKLHPHGEVLPLHVTSRNIAHTWGADSHLGYNLRDSWWGVPPFVVLPEVSEQLDELSEVHFKPEDFRNGLRVEVESICGQLNLTRKPFATSLRLLGLRIEQSDKLQVLGNIGYV
jgi:hypothetical protein